MIYCCANFTTKVARVNKLILKHSKLIYKKDHLLKPQFYWHLYCALTRVKKIIVVEK